MAIGRTLSGRLLRVIYVPDPQPDSYFVITGFELQGKAALAYRRRQRKKQRMKQSKFSPSWDEQRVRRVLEHYESQTEEEAVAEDEAG
jgi:hypothetical protein